ncbi:hypothetical protein [Rubrivirga marina]|uniref:SGNH hydrolase-type esterase domain-containing protein n=1 Tax=Rubrivirga marina TaxID=1196024 RepID=A0A271IZD3_9BACT|nr:hypothetical protein [Rubrivirga marina]PAP76596.1 hypothetical protein BSZ37_09160 [Rubrivirga marina]
MPRLSALLLLLSLLACGSADPVDTTPDPGFNVLFVGNSLTYTNDLPGMVGAMLPTFGGEDVHIGTVASADVSLEDHWYLGGAREAIASGDWDVVVMQQGPSSVPQNQVHLATWVGHFADLAETHGVRPAVLMVWPPEGDEARVEAVVTAYATAAREADAALFPAGAAWRLARAEGTADPYGLDRFHPSPAGTYLAALTVVGGLTEGSTVGLRALGGVSAPTARALQVHADAALAAYLSE